MFENLTIAEQLLFSTVRIDCDNGRSVGTGFFFCITASKGYMPLLVTNKHVVEGARSGRFVLTRRNTDNKPMLGQIVNVQLDDFARRWIPHPDADIDLCVMPINPILEAAESKSAPIFHRHVETSIIPDQQKLEELDAIEDVLMIGYPSGVWDKANNMPVVRRGITATHPALDFEGKPIELIDIACFPGSSGSPVFITKEGVVIGRNGAMSVGNSRLMLLGIVFKSVIYDARGEIRIVDAPTALVPAISTTLHTNLAIMIKAQKLLDFIPVIEKMV